MPWGDWQGQVHMEGLLSGNLMNRVVGSPEVAWLLLPGVLHVVLRQQGPALGPKQ